MGLLNFLSRLVKAGTSGFNEFELIVLNELAAALPADLQGRLRRRIEAVNLVQRLDGGREVNCYVLQNGKPVRQVETRLDATLGEKVLAEFVVEGPPGTANTGEVWLVDGNVFSIEFNRATEHADPDAVARVLIKLAPIVALTA